MTDLIEDACVPLITPVRVKIISQIPPPSMTSFLSPLFSQACYLQADQCDMGSAGCHGHPQSMYGLSEIHNI